ncbi:hypothetical protein JW872_01750 [Candidatus Babeliales bacterium]|nr:hypothetical protein [Candidatus Babeliales bacterium]
MKKQILFITTTALTFVNTQASDSINITFVNKTPYAITARFVIDDGTIHGRPTTEGFLINASLNSKTGGEKTDIELNKLYWFEKRGTGLGSNTVMNVVMGKIPNNAYLMSQGPEVGGDYKVELSDTDNQTYELTLNNKNQLVVQPMLERVKKSNK